jgi:hypothetical protein
VNNFWNDLQIGAKDKIELAASFEDKTKKAIKSICPPIEKYEVFTDASGAGSEFDAAVKAQENWEKCDKDVQNNKVEYNNEMMDIESASAKEIEQKK